MVCRFNARMPAIFCSWMISRRAALPFLAVDVFAVRSLLDSVVIPEEASLTEFRDQQVNDILEGAGFDSICLDLLAKYTL